MTHKFDPKFRHKLNSKERRMSLPPKETLQKLGLKEGDVVADIGCGIGYFTIPAAKMITEQGRVYAIDISKEMLLDLQQRVKDEGLSNIDLINGTEYSAKMDDESTDFILLSNIIHEITDKKLFFKSYLKKLEVNGRIAIIEWKKEKTEQGPTVAHRVSSQKLYQLLTELGIKIIKEVNLNSNQYGLVGKKINCT